MWRIQVFNCLHTSNTCALEHRRNCLNRYTLSAAQTRLPIGRRRHSRLKVHDAAGERTPALPAPTPAVCPASLTPGAPEQARTAAQRRDTGERHRALFLAFPHLLDRAKQACSRGRCRSWFLRRVHLLVPGKRKPLCRARKAVSPYYCKAQILYCEFVD